MKVLVVGSGGREHALVRALLHSEPAGNVFAAPGSDGIALDVECWPWNGNDKTSLSKWAKDKGIELVVIGPEGPLADGLADHLRGQGFLVFGPEQKAAMLEASKIYAKQFMFDAGVPTAFAVSVQSVAETMQALPQFKPPYVLKADGLAAGKGVVICKDQQSIIKAAQDFFENKILGEAGKQALLEQFTPGFEVSLLVITNGKSFEILPLSQDHKRLLDGDQGPNTGGMGTVAPMHLANELMQEIEARVVKPSVNQLVQRQMQFRGVLFIGLMITDQGPSVLEYNVRFGDPETQVVLPLLDGNWADVFRKVAQGDMPKLKWRDTHTACVVIASEGYPDAPKTGAVIGSLAGNLANNLEILHAGTQFKDGVWLTKGGRVLNVLGEGKDRKTALSKAYALADKVCWPSGQFRKDIGKNTDF